MYKKIALLIIYNHRYDKNIPVLEELFKDKFSHIFHIVPFYDGDRKNVIPVYESSYYFSGYIAQALNQIKDESYTHYVFTSDDLMLNPILDENNIIEKIGLSETDCYMPRFRSLDNAEWSRSFDALTYAVSGLGAEVEKILPSKQDAENLLKSEGFYECLGVPGRIAFKVFFKNIKKVYNWYLPVGFILSTIKRLLRHPFNYYYYNYPLLGGYNDFFIITSNNKKRFIQYCGAFAASGLFVELALPTALALSSERIRTSSDTNFKCGDLWGNDIFELEDKYKKNLKAFLSDYPSDLLYIHPVKLSKWK